MKRWVFYLLVALCAASAARTIASGIVYQKQVVHSVPVHVVYVNLDDPDVKVTVALAKRGRGTSESASSMISRTRPVAAVTGTFFDTRSLLPTGDIVISGVKVHSGCVGPALCISPDNQAEIVPQKYRPRRYANDYETVLAGGPTLVWEGKIALNPRAEGFSDPALFRMARRTAAGITKNHKLMMVSVNRAISMRHLAKIMLALGAQKALLLDGGTSTAMYAGGRFCAVPGRRLTNLLMVYKTSDSYRQAVARLAPNLAAHVLPRTFLRASADPAVEEPWYRRLDSSIGFRSIPSTAFRLQAADTAPVIRRSN